MFESLRQNLEGIFRRLGGKGKVRDKDLRDALKEVRNALLEADVNYEVAKDFERSVARKALGAEVLKGLRPVEQVIKIVHEELVHLLGDAAVPITMAGRPPTIVLMAGLQGSGKTTHCGKLAIRLQREGHKVLLAATDVYRAAAIQQLQTVGEQAGAEVFTLGDRVDPVDIAKAAVSHGAAKGFDVVIIDTAGRLAIDEAMMAEVERMEAAFDEVETLLVVDAMTGQDAVNVATEFSRRLHLDGVVLTKLDGDARGGAALSVRHVTGRPIKFVGVGEGLEALDVFYPDRMAQRILGMGDLLTFIERAQTAMDAETALEMQRKLLEDQFDLEDFRQHLRNMRKMGPVGELLRMIPGMEQAQGLLPSDAEGEAELDMVDAVICSMTMKERRDPELLNGSRRRRIARGCGRSVQDVNIVIKQWRELRGMMAGMKGGQPVQIGNLRIGQPGAAPPGASRGTRRATRALKRR